MGDLSGDGPDDLEGLDASAAHVANLLSTEPANSMFFIFCILQKSLTFCHKLTATWKNKIKTSKIRRVNNMLLNQFIGYVN